MQGSHIASGWGKHGKKTMKRHEFLISLVSGPGKIFAFSSCMCFIVTAEVQLGHVLQILPSANLTWKNKLTLAAAFPASSGFLFSLPSPGTIGWCVRIYKRTGTATHPPLHACSPQLVLAQKCLRFCWILICLFFLRLCFLASFSLCLWQVTE